MYTVEEKLDLVMRCITTNNNAEYHDLRSKIRDALATGGSPEHKSTDMHDVIADIFNELGIRRGLLGYDHLATAIELVYSDATLIHAITKRLYPEVALKYGTTPIRVERAMRTAIESGMGRGHYESIVAIFGYTIDPYKGKPTNSQFIATCVAEVQRRMKATGSHEVA